MPEDYALAIYVELKRIVAELNNNRVYHCDLKSQNLILARDQKLKIIDFGTIVFNLMEYGRHGWTKGYFFLYELNINIKDLFNQIIKKDESEHLIKLKDFSKI